MISDANISYVMDSLLTAVMVLNARLDIIHMNAAAESLMGVSIEHAEGKPLSMCFLDSDATPSSVAQSIRQDVSFTRRRATWQLKNNREKTVDYSVTPDNHCGHIIMEVQELDRLLRISRDEAWLSSQETTNNMVRSMAHEIKNPLGGIRGAAQLLARQLDSSDLEEFTKIIIGEADRLRNLTDRMLGPTKPIRHQKFAVHEVLEHVASVIGAEAQGRALLTKDYDPSIPDLIGDKEQLIQALLNVVRNALQALLENNTASPQITLKTRVKRRYTIGRKTHKLIAEIMVTDNGPGIPPSLVEDIFFPMITGRAEGTGLGLSISQNIITRHGGLIECASMPGKTEFAIYLPLGKNDA